ncbi:MAG: hypothetical protein IJG63_00325, partial [Oscillospiraceae bacterium]|nr:hypothetical protein [Oscillospiraceae bacterium]
DNRFDPKEMDAVLGRVFPDSALKGGDGDIKRLREGMDRASARSAAYAELSGRSRDGRRKRLFGELSGEEKANMRRLQAAHFILTGDSYAPNAPRLSARSAPELLRQLYIAETGDATAYGRAAIAAGDGTLSLLYSGLSDSGMRHAEQISRLIESMMK